LGRTEGKATPSTYRAVHFSEWKVFQDDDGSPVTDGVLGGKRAGYELIRHYDFSRDTPDVPALGWPEGPVRLQITCRLESDYSGFAVHTLLFLHFRPFQLQQETSLLMDLFTVDGQLGARVPVVAHPGSDDSVLLAVMGDSESTRTCVHALVSGKPTEVVLFAEPADEDKKRQL
jgi:hypothetical protein